MAFITQVIGIFSWVDNPSEDIQHFEDLTSYDCRNTTTGPLATTKPDSGLQFWCNALSTEAQKPNTHKTNVDVVCVYIYIHTY